ncbi:MAG: hypothetical protein RL687_490, partial [Candidatus Parcubacteria bacterium]
MKNSKKYTVTVQKTSQKQPIKSEDPIFA